eukprot:c15734_g1_i1.p1 GENE.c15734_g1_i1~~c15734_g1_i1.p1  ORF type:complete len:197 (+),score=75.20 c15734_g1_i1:41-631(+)
MSVNIKEEEKTEDPSLVHELMHKVESGSGMIPTQVINYYLQKGGCISPDPKLQRLFGLAAQKFVVDILRDTIQVHYINNPKKRPLQEETKREPDENDEFDEAEVDPEEDEAEKDEKDERDKDDGDDKDDEQTSKRAKHDDEDKDKYRDKPKKAKEKDPLIVSLLSSELAFCLRENGISVRKPEYFCDLRNKIKPKP